MMGCESGNNKCQVNATEHLRREKNNKKFCGCFTDRGSFSKAPLAAGGKMKVNHENIPCFFYCNVLCFSLAAFMVHG